MKKEDTKELQDLSLVVFGNKHTWKKLTSRGLVLGTDKELPYVVRRIKLSNEQAKNYMLKTIEMRKGVDDENR